ncbi:MAG: hypothetical protein KDA61_02520, partial [Planctomycetales bacterium]|nr:hypothetical protein [Planctomycetales bacterium]
MSQKFAVGSHASFLLLIKGRCRFWEMLPRGKSAASIEARDWHLVVATTKDRIETAAPHKTGFLPEEA